MAKLSLSRAWDESRAVMQSDGRLIASVALALVLLPQAIAGVIGPPATLSGEEPPSWMPLVSLVVFLAAIAGQIAIIRLALGPRISVGEAIGHGFRRLLPGFIAVVIFVLALGLVLTPVLLLLAGPSFIEALARGTAPESGMGAIVLVAALAILIWAWFQMILPVTTAEPGGPFHALKRTVTLSGGNYGRLLVFLLLVIVTLIVLVGGAQIVGGSIGRVLFGDTKAFSIGALIVALFTALAQTILTVGTSVMLARMYVQLAGRPEAQASVPTTGI